MRSRVSDAQAAVDFDAPPEPKIDSSARVPSVVCARISPAPSVTGTEGDGRKMTAEDHRWFAGAYRGKQEEMIGRAAEWPEHGAELAKVAAQWKQMATVHEFTANRMEGTE